MGSANYDGAHFTGADLTDADVGLASFKGAILRGAKLHGAIDLADADLKGAIADDTTQWPDGFDPAARGVLFR
jgi:uncharacterized protein YjbI with pentapeptide repeats